MLFLVFFKTFNFIDFYSIILIIFFNLIILNTVTIYFMKNPIYSLILLILNYIIVGFLFIFNGILFLGLIFILVYTGAISILLIFTLMLLNLRTIYFKSNNINYMYSLQMFFYLVQLSLFLFLLDKNKFSIFDDYIFTNWKKFIEIDSDFFLLSKILFFNFLDLVFISSIFLTFVLIVSTFIISVFKEAEKQDPYLQVKKYKKKFLS